MIRLSAAGVNQSFRSPIGLKENSFFVLAQECAEAYEECRGDGIVVCIQSASRDESASHPAGYLVLLSNDRCIVKIGARRNTQGKFPDMPCMKKVYKDKWPSVHWSTASNEERSRSRC